jgi:hypothetical protein
MLDLQAFLAVVLTPIAVIASGVAVGVLALVSILDAVTNLTE